MIQTANYNLSKPEMSDTIGEIFPALAANFAILDGMDLVTEKVIGTVGYIKYKSGLIIQWGTCSRGGVGTQLQYGTTGIFKMGFNANLSKPLTHIIGGDTFGTDLTVNDRVWKSTIIPVSASIVNFKLMCLGNVADCTDYNWWVMGY